MPIPFWPSWDNDVGGNREIEKKRQWYNSNRAWFGRRISLTTYCDTTDSMYRRFMEFLRTDRVVYKIGSSESHAVLKNSVYIKIRSRFVLVLCVFQVVVWKATTEGMCGVDDGYAV